MEALKWMLLIATVARQPFAWQHTLKSRIMGSDIEIESME